MPQASPDARGPTNLRWSGPRRAEQLVGRSIIIVANLAPRMLRGEESRGMLLAASTAPKDPAAAAQPERQVILLTTAADIALGAIVG